MADISPAEARESLADIDFTARQMRRTLAASQFSCHLMTWGLVWIAIIAYAEMLGWLLPLPTVGARLVVIVTIVMLGYVVLGIWLRSSILSLIGLGVTLATLAGWHWLLPRDFMLWMAVFGGGGLFVPGLYVQLRWK